MGLKKTYKEIPKSSTEKIIVSLSEWNDSEYVDIRLWFDASGGRNTEWKPGKKGITIKPEFLEDLREGINLAISELIGEDEGKDKEV